MRVSMYHCDSGAFNPIHFRVRDQFCGVASQLIREAYKGSVGDCFSSAKVFVCKTHCFGWTKLCLIVFMKRLFLNE
ncbi:hypothetical protein CDL12_27607 [Handroanthus impetiginosus]|uniref:Uncharacterized protein n=1 Tax=Handroanthus impetiginosus TaxID=429701 RepID=A0A2G9G3X5_9LAMI|nr:hypothetical protein CDL12_27607 [Handroanthus impetiginosus]